MDKLPQISEAEYEIMKIIWDESPISTNSICEKVPSIHNWSNKTVHTLLSRLVSKHVISYEQKGRMYYYFPIISKNKYLSQENHNFLSRFYDGEMAPLLSSLLSIALNPFSICYNKFKVIWITKSSWLKYKFRYKISLVLNSIFKPIRVPMTFPIFCYF